VVRYIRRVTGAIDLRWVPGAIVTVAIGFGVPLYILPDMFGPSEAIAFVGILVTASVTLIGYLRLNREQEEQNQRLKLDAAMRAGALFDPADGGRIQPASAASGLLALTKLDHADLAVVLLVDLWSGDQGAISTETAVLVIDAALRSRKDPNAQLIAAELLCRNATRLDSCQSLHWPSAVDGCWDPTFGPKTKLLLVDALTQMTLAGPHNENALRSVAVRLYGIWSGDHDMRVRGCVGTLIRSLMPELSRLGYADFLQGNKKVMIGELEAAAASATSNPDGFLDRLVVKRSQLLGEWATACEGVDSGAGSLASAAYLG
jgi:hypothetical protein